jgi:hypothetical protein
MVLLATSIAWISAWNSGEHPDDKSHLLPKAHFGLRLGDSTVLQASDITKTCLIDPNQSSILASDNFDRMALWSKYVREMPILFDIRTQTVKNQLESKRFELSQTRPNASGYLNLAINVADLQLKVDQRKFPPSSHSLSIDLAYSSLLDNESVSDSPSTKRSVEIMHAVLLRLQENSPLYLPLGSKGIISEIKTVNADDDTKSFQMMHVVFEFKKEHKSVWLDESYLENDVPQKDGNGVVRDPVAYGGFRSDDSEAFHNAKTAGDEFTWKNLVKKARIVKLKKGTKIHVVGEASGLIQAKIIDGAYKGKVLYISYSQVVTGGPLQ